MKLLGLQVAERVVRSLRTHGLEEVTVVGSPEILPRSLRSKVRFVDLDEMEVVRYAAAQLAEGDALFVVPGDTVYHPEMPAAFRREAFGRERSIAFGETPEHSLLYLRRSDVTHLPKTDNFAMLVDTLCELDTCQRLADRGELFAKAVGNQHQQQEARRALLGTCWRPDDGIVTRLINRRISVPLSAALVDGKATPGQLTSLSLLIGLAAICCCAWGSYGTLLAGALLLQLKAIIGGCDGTLARLRLQRSRAGGWYATVVDDLLEVLWVAAAGIGAWRSLALPLYAEVGLAGAALHLVAALLCWLALARRGLVRPVHLSWHGRRPRPGQSPELPALARWLRHAARRDVAVVGYLALAAAGLPRAVLALATLRALGWFVLAIVQTARGTPARENTPLPK